MGTYNWLASRYLLVQLVESLFMKAQLVLRVDKASHSLLELCKRLYYVCECPRSNLNRLAVLTPSASSFSSNSAIVAATSRMREYELL